MGSESKRDDQVQDLISLKDSQEIDTWCKRLRCTAAELGLAIGDVGFSFSAVSEYLAERKRVPPPL